MQMFKGSGQKRDTSAAKARGTNAAANRLAPAVLKRPKPPESIVIAIWTFYDLPLFHPCHAFHHDLIVDAASIMLLIMNCAGPVKPFIGERTCHTSALL